MVAEFNNHSDNEIQAQFDAWKIVTDMIKSRSQTVQYTGEKPEEVLESLKNNYVAALNKLPYSMGFRAYDQAIKEATQSDKSPNVSYEVKDGVSEFTILAPSPNLRVPLLKEMESELSYGLKMHQTEALRQNGGGGHWSPNQTQQTYKTNMARITAPSWNR